MIFLYEQKNFIKWASLEIDDLLPNITKFFTFNSGNTSILIEVIFENILGALVIFGSYFIGKKLFFNYNKNRLKIILKILFFIYAIIIIYAIIVMPLVGCFIKIG